MVRVFDDHHDRTVEPPEPSVETITAVHSSTALSNGASRANSPASRRRIGHRTRRDDSLSGRDVVDLQRYHVLVGAYPVCPHVHTTRVVERNHELDERAVGEQAVGVRQRRCPAGM